MSIASTKHPFTTAREQLDIDFRQYVLEALEHEDDSSLLDTDSTDRLKDFLYWAGHRYALPMAE